MSPEPIETWLSQVAYSHSDSESTRYAYKKTMENFCLFHMTAPKEILADYERLDEKTFKRKYSQFLQEWITELYRLHMKSTTIRSKIGAVKSFFKYNSLPLGFIPQAKEMITYHNRDIEAKEIALIMANSKPREKAIYALMAQSGLRGHTIKKLRLKNIEDLNTERLSYKITIPQGISKGKFGSHVAFIGEESAKYLRLYLATRTALTPESLLFCTHGKPNTPVNLKNLSRAFQTTALKLRKTGALNYEVREKGKPSELRLYTLRKFFKRKCKEIGDEDTNYLMGHTIVGANGNYAPRNPEYYRKRYEEKALPFLRLESPTPTDTEQLRETMRKHHQEEMEALRNQVKERDEQLEAMNKRFEKIEKALEISPESKANLTQQSKIIYQDERGHFARVPISDEQNKRLQEEAEKRNMTPDELIKKLFDLERLSLKEKVKEDTEKQT
jgi:site-specific recombinase XerD